MPPRRQQGVPPRRGPPRQGRREIYDPIDVGMRDVESVHQDRTEMEINSPPRSRQRAQGQAPAQAQAQAPAPVGRGQCRVFTVNQQEAHTTNTAVTGIS